MAAQFDTSFSINAHKWTNKSLDCVNKEKYFQAWVDSIPAKFFYIADLITNISMIPFSLIKILFSSLESLYTWGHKTKNLNNAINSLYHYANNSISSFTGIFSIEFAKFIRNKNNVKNFFSISFTVSMIGLFIFSIFRAEGFELYYNFKDGSWQPYFYWDFNKMRSHSH